MSTIAIVVNVYGATNMAQIDKAQASLNRLKTEVAGQTGTWSKFSNVVSGAWAKLGSGLAALEAIKWLKGSITAAQQFQLVQQQLTQAVRNVEPALSHSKILWNAYEKQMNTVVNAESKLSAFSKGSLEGALATLTTATGSAGRGLSLLAITADLARAKHLDLGAAAKLVGKVAMGNTTALTRYGIVMAKGSTATQALAVMQTKFGGQAKVYGDSSAGSAAKFSNALKELQITVGTALLPALNGLMRDLTVGLGLFQKLPGPVKDVAVGLAALTGAGALLAPWTSTILPIFKGMGGIAVKAAGGLTNFATGLTNSTAAGSAFATPMMRLGGLVSSTASAIAGLVVKLATAGAAFVVSTAQLIAHTVASVASAVATTAVTVATTAWTAAQWLLNLALDANPIGIIIIAIAAFVGALILAWQHCGTFRAIVIGAWNAIKAATVTAFNTVRTVILGVWGAIKTGAAAVRSFVVGVWNAIKNAAVTAFTAVVTFVKGIPKKIKTAIGDLGKLLYNTGSDIVNGLKNGIVDAWHYVTDKLASLINLIPGPLRKLLGISSPSKVMAQIGRQIPAGLAMGINAGRQDVMAAMTRMGAATMGAGGGSAFAFSGAGASSGAGGGVSITLVQNIDARGSSLSTADIKGAASDGAAPALERLAREVRMVVRH